MLLGLIVSLHSITANDQTLSPYDISDTQNVAEVSVYGDGHLIAYSLTVPRPFSDSPGSAYRELYVFDTETEKSIPLITGKNSINSIGWTPDGHISFRFTGNGVNGFQVFTINPSNGEPEQLTRFDRSIISYEFIEDGKLYHKLKLHGDAPLSGLSDIPEKVTGMPVILTVWIILSAPWDGLITILKTRGLRMKCLTNTLITILTTSK